MSLEGTTLGRYRILRALGQGGMGQVWAAEDPELGREVAIKLLPPELAGDPDRLQRFRNEARTVAALKHPNIVTIHSVEAAEGRHFITMELVEGRPLSKSIGPDGLPPERILELAIPLCDAVAQAHARGITHRDLKPDNVMIDSDGRVKVLDFGLARVAGRPGEGQDATITAEGRILGTVAYMSPEQAQGLAVDPRSDVFSLGILLYEMATGARPFKGENNVSILTSILRDVPRPVSDSRPKYPPVFDRIIGRCLQKNPAQRYATALELKRDLSSLAGAPSAGPSRRRGPRAIALAVALAAVAVVAAVWIQRSGRERWARAVAIPRIQELAERSSWLERGMDGWEAHELAIEAAAVLGDDPLLEQAWTGVASEISITSDPPGARVLAKAYVDDEGEWRTIGETPLEKTRFPRGASRMRVELDGYEPAEDLVFNIGYLGSDWHFKLQPAGTLPEGMVFVAGALAPLRLPGVDHLEGQATSDFLIDRYEVTNREYKAFVDAGGYADPRYWVEPFTEDGRTLPREVAMARLVDTTGRPGPAGWVVGAYGEGEDDLPVSGISWYEAAAYARFAGSRLPTIYHWNQVAATWVSGEIVPLANFGGRGPHAAGAGGAMHRHGTYDLAGNVREWCRNATTNRDARFILGGGWNDAGYAFNDAYAQSPWDRSPTNGVRCIRSLGEEPEALSAAIDLPFRDFYHETPVSDETFALFLRQFEYDPLPLDARIEQERDGGDWIQQRVSFNAAYGGERVPGWLFLPKTPPPHRTVVYFPGSGAIHSRSSDDPSMRFFAPLLRAGRAVMFPIYKGTYERGTELDSDYPEQTVFYKDHVIMWGKDLSRSIDYLESRDDLDTSSLAFCGFSWGGVMGTVLPAVESRIRVNVLYVAGLLFQRALPEVDQINYVGRVRQPTLMVNGEFDFFFPVATSQKPLYDLLGTPDEHKRYVVYPGSHSVPPAELVRELLSWLDRYQPPPEG